MNKRSIFRIILEAKVARCWLQRSFWVAEWVICIDELEFNKEIHSWRLLVVDHDESRRRGDLQNVNEASQIQKQE
jgi:hypothetical protein